MRVYATRSVLLVVLASWIETNERKPGHSGVRTLSPRASRERAFRARPREKMENRPESGKEGNVTVADASRYSSRSTLLKNFHPAWDAAETISERDRNGLSIVHSEDLWQKSLAAHKSGRVLELCANAKRECDSTRDYSFLSFLFLVQCKSDFRWNPSGTIFSVNICWACCKTLIVRAPWVFNRPYSFNLRTRGLPSSLTLNLNNRV